jgi:hypothetical protein
MNWCNPCDPVTVFTNEASTPQRMIPATHSIYRLPALFHVTSLQTSQHELAKLDSTCALPRCSTQVFYRGLN